MAETVVSFLLESLKDYVSETANLLSNLKERIEGMDETLRLLQDDVNNRQGGQISQRRILRGRHIRDISYEFENVKDRFNEVMASGGRCLGLFKFQTLKIIGDLSEIGLDIDGIHSRINLLESAVDEDQISDSTVINQTPDDQLLEHFVGRAEEVSELRSLIFNDDPIRHQVIAICGTCGLGKTAICWKLFREAERGEYFDLFAWVNVSDRFQTSEILQSIYNQIVEVPERRIAGMSEANQAREINKIQREKKCLIVLDGLWSSDAWLSLRSVFPSTGDSNSKILITTRVLEAAEKVGAKIHILRGLKDDEACKLILRTVGTNSLDYEQVRRKIEASGKDIVKCCEGLPLAVTKSVELALGHSPDEWSHDLFLAMTQKIGVEQSILLKLGLSFDNLPHFLVPCFLYLGVLEDNNSRLEAEKLYLFLLAEKFILEKHQEREETLMDVAERYLYDLEKRGMIEVQEAQVPSLTKISSCRLNPLMRQLCRAKNEELGFSKVMDDIWQQQQQPRSSSPQGTKPYRVFINLDKWDQKTYGSMLRKESKHIRGMLLRVENPEQFVKWPKELRTLFRFKYLKVLNFTGFSFRGIKLPRSVMTLSRLRCLSFNGCRHLARLPSSIKKLKLLEILDLRVEDKMIIPYVLRKLKKLKHLYFPESFKTQGADKLELDGLEELETITNMNTKLINVEKLNGLSNLCYINATIEGSLDDTICIAKRMNMGAGSRLFKASIKICDFDCYTDERLSVLRKIIGCKSLIIFRMSGYMYRLPLEDGGLIMDSNLVELDLAGSELLEDSMETLESLPKLRVLVLKDDAFMGKKMTCSATRFQELRRLELLNLGNLEKLIVDGKGMAKLCNLTMRNCVKLKMQVGELGFVGGGQVEVTVSGMCEEFNHSLRQVGGNIKFQD